MWQFLVSNMMTSPFKEFVSSCHCLWSWRMIRIIMLSTLVILGALCLPGRMPYFLFQSSFHSFCPLTLSFRERGNEEHDTAGEDLFLEATEGRLSQLGKKATLEQRNPGGSVSCHICAVCKGNDILLLWTCVLMWFLLYNWVVY